MIIAANEHISTKNIRVFPLSLQIDTDGFTLQMTFSKLFSLHYSSSLIRDK